jgi:hypothetical protein
LLGQIRNVQARTAGLGLAVSTGIMRAHKPLLAALGLAVVALATNAHGGGRRFIGGRWVESYDRTPWVHGSHGSYPAEPYKPHVWRHGADGVHAVPVSELKPDHIWTHGPDGTHAIPLDPDKR